MMRKLQKFRWVALFQPGRSFFPALEIAPLKRSMRLRSMCLDASQHTSKTDIDRAADLKKRQKKQKLMQDYFVSCAQNSPIGYNGYIGTVEW